MTGKHARFGGVHLVATLSGVISVLTAGGITAAIGRIRIQALMEAAARSARSG